MFGFSCSSQLYNLFQKAILHILYLSQPHAVTNNHSRQHRTDQVESVFTPVNKSNRQRHRS